MSGNETYQKDIELIKSMMERSSKFRSLSGWAGILAGIYALIGAYCMHTLYGFSPQSVNYNKIAHVPHLSSILWLFLSILALALATAFILSFQRSRLQSEPFWSSTTKRLVVHTGLPLLTGGICCMACVSLNCMGLFVPFTLLFYGISLFNAGNYTFSELKWLGALMQVLGLLSLFHLTWSLFFWAIGFGLLHLVFGTYIHLKHQK